ncbi:MAG TPA: disulfide bond formation protein B [Aestuariivirga sp.]|nr:disulfide bond formation protein B [Aestuariivirga sp.]
MTPQRAALLVFAAATATLFGAWLFEYFGYAPCELCLKQRWAYYAAIPLSLMLALAARNNSPLARNGLYLLALIMFGSAIFGAYHAGVEWTWWPGPGTCSGDGGLSGGLPDLNKPVVMCDEPAIRILGLSLAGWNALISLALAIVALKGARTFSRA